MTKPKKVVFAYHICLDSTRLPVVTVGVRILCVGPSCLTCSAVDDWFWVLANFPFLLTPKSFLFLRRTSTDYWSRLFHICRFALRYPPVSWVVSASPDESAA